MNLIRLNKSESRLWPPKDEMCVTGAVLHSGCVVTVSVWSRYNDCIRQYSSVGFLI